MSESALEKALAHEFRDEEHQVANVAIDLKVAPPKELQGLRVPIDEVGQSG